MSHLPSILRPAALAVATLFLTPTSFVTSTAAIATATTIAAITTSQAEAKPQPKVRSQRSFGTNSTVMTATSHAR